MNEKLDTIIKYMQGKNTTFTVAEINEISGMLNSLKEAKKDEPEKETKK
mgnify:CR=1 FL=1